MASNYDHKNILVRIDTTQFKFPELCPVCGDRSVDSGLIARSIENKHFSNKPYYPRYSYRSRTSRPRTTEVRRLKIPVCDRHFFSIDEMGRVRAILTFSGGISLAISIAIGIVMGFSTYDQLLIPMTLQSLFLLSLVIMVISMYGLGPSKLDRAVKIVDFDISAQTIVLQIRNKWYVDEMLQRNGSSAQIVIFKLKPRF